MFGKLFGSKPEPAKKAAPVDATATSEKLDS
jgi:hypothetical protein